MLVKYSDKAEEDIIREYFGSFQATETPRCASCGEVLRFDTDYATKPDSLRIRVRCRECGVDFTWQQPRARQPWLPLHLRYFLERYREGGVIRCPFDDCSVSCVEFSDGVMEFRCPYCNHRGRISLPPPTLD